MNLADTLLSDLTTNPVSWWRTVKKAGRVIAPYPEFLPAIQTASHQLQPGESWWHVPVTVKRPSFVVSGVIPRCSVAVKISDGDNILAERSMRWLTTDDGGSAEKIDLECGRIENVPIAHRIEELAPNFGGAAMLTDVHALVYKAGKSMITPGRYDVCIEIQSGARKWTEAVCGIRYVLIVPPSGVSNGQFLLHTFKISED